MKVFRVSNEKYGYCDDIECIVVAESEEAIRSKITKNHSDSRLVLTIDGRNFVNYLQGEITIEEIDLSKEAILCINNMGA